MLKRRNINMDDLNTSPLKELNFQVSVCNFQFILGAAPGIGKIFSTAKWIFSSNQNQVFCYTCCIMLKRVTGLRGQSPRHCTCRNSASKKYHSGGVLLVTLSPIWPAQDLNCRPIAPKTNAILLYQPAGIEYFLEVPMYFLFFLLVIEYYRLIIFSVLLYLNIIYLILNLLMIWKVLVKR